MHEEVLTLVGKYPFVTLLLEGGPMPGVVYMHSRVDQYVVVLGCGHYLLSGV